MSETKCYVPRIEFSNTSYTRGTLPKLFVNFFFFQVFVAHPHLYHVQLSVGQKW